MLIFIYSIFIVLLFPSQISLWLGDQLLSSGHFDEAITEYKRYIFLNYGDNSPAASFAYFKMGLAYRQLELWGESLQALRNSVQTEGDYFQRDKKRITLAVTLLASGNSSEAEFLLLRTELYSPFPEIKAKAAFFRGISLALAKKWKEAQEAFQACAQTTSSMIDVEEVNHLVTLVEKAQGHRYKSPKLAKTLSSVLPGMGQIYAGDFLKGLNALALNSLFGYIVVSDILQKDYWDFLFNSSFLFWRFYSGNRIEAEATAKGRNQKLDEQFIHKLLEKLKGMRIED